MSLDDFEKVAVLGAGAFGQVLLVRQGSSYYALKVLSKQHLLQTGLQVCTRKTCMCAHDVAP
jgi:hypothetical protein